MASSEPKQAGKWLIGGARRASASLHTACASSWWVTEGQVPRFPWLVGKRPYNQRLEGIAPFFPQKDFDLGVGMLGAGMKERGWIEPGSLEPIVERVVGQVLEVNAAQLRSEIVRRVMDEIAAEAATLEAAAAEAMSAEAISAEPANHPTASEFAEDLARAIAEIQSGSSQREILRALLDTSSRYAARVALFVVKGSHAAGW